MSKRLNIALPESTISRIESVKEMTDAASYTDVIRSALLTYEALVEFVSDGNKFYVKKPDSDQYEPVRFVFDVKSKAAA